MYKVKNKDTRTIKGNYQWMRVDLNLICAIICTAFDFDS